MIKMNFKCINCNKEVERSEEIIQVLCSCGYSMEENKILKQIIKQKDTYPINQEILHKMENIVDALERM